MKNDNCVVCGTEKMLMLDEFEEDKALIADYEEPLIMNKESGKICIVRDCWCPNCGIKYHTASV